MPHPKLIEAAKTWKEAWENIAPGYVPPKEEEIVEWEEYYGKRLPDSWRFMLSEAGFGQNIGFTWPDEFLSLSPNNSAEHEVETGVGHALAAADKTVIGYFDGLGDCLIIDNKEENPEVIRTGSGDRSLGLLSDFLNTLSGLIMDRKGLAIVPLIAHLKAGNEFRYEFKWGRHMIYWRVGETKRTNDMVFEEFEILKREVGFDPRTP